MGNKMMASGGSGSDWRSVHGAIAALTTQIEAQPTKATLYKERGDLFLVASVAENVDEEKSIALTKKAISDFEQVVQLQGPSAALVKVLNDCHRDLGKLLLDTDAFAEAEGALHKSLTFDANDHVALFYLGSVLLRSERPDEAVERLTEATALQRDPDYFFYRASAYLEKGTAEAGALAVADLQAALRARKGDPKYLMLLGEAYLLSGDEVKAKAALAESLRGDPDNDYTKGLLAQCK